ncbi:uncharacterized protein LOC124257649 [Haliotis rubra]|uniref:uncharacterized protein LOC124257649 n=1 Tax=Haliotis rubra TaxID=36100 RepID=UPI001EE61F89|nr:uncharacterized protein LOC124257649 [Haliotis rubra]
MRVLLLFIVSRFGLCQDNIEASVDILKPHPGLRSCTLPREFTVTVRTHNESATLRLVTSTSVKSTAPVYVCRQEKGNPVIVRDTVLDPERTAEYQDVTHLSNMEVSCVMKKNSKPYYIFEGFLVFSGRSMFELKPTRSASGDVKYTLTSTTVHNKQIDADDDGENGRSGNGGSGSAWESMASHSLRKKRQIQSPIYVDVIAVLELSVYKRWLSRATQPTPALKDQETKQGLRRHFAHLLNGDELSPKPFQNAIVNETKIEGNQLLNDIINWKADTPGFPDNDHVVVFTALDLFAIAGNTTDLLGYAEIGAVCEYPEDSVSAVEYTDNLVDDMLVTTHEIGHALSALHDGDQNTCNSSYQYIMSGFGYSSTQVLDHNNYYVFSTCSLSYIQNFIQGILANGTNAQQECLQKPLEPVSVTNITGTMPGQLYDVHTQCQMMYGPGYFLRLDVDIGGSENICKRMACGKEEIEMFHNAADGTPCGNKKWCVAGECVFSIDAPGQNNPDCLYGNQPVVYPQNRTCDELISATPRLCYTSYYGVCCEACLDNKKNDENCLYGDRYVDCDTVITQNTTRLCYNEDNAEGCCETCSAFVSSLATTTTTTTTPTTTTTTTTTSTTTTTTTTTATPTPTTTISRRESSSPTTTSTPAAAAPPAATPGFPPSDFLTEPQKILIGASFALGLGILVIIAVVFCVKRGICGTWTKEKAPQMRTEDVDYTAPPLGVSSRGYSTYQPRF